MLNCNDSNGGHFRFLHLRGTNLQINPLMVQHPRHFLWEPRGEAQGTSVHTIFVSIPYLLIVFLLTIPGLISFFNIVDNQKIDNVRINSKVCLSLSFNFLLSGAFLTNRFEDL